ncbi:MAG: hypothetical protein KDD41_03430 [Flavobacteriales bacterium]|nr:hypothetical protein [Flavobacteriales bacterium]
MTYNLLSYIIYAPIAIYITVVVGYQCYKNGLVYVLSIFQDENLSLAINRILLTGYYLTNIGYAVLIIESWEEVQSVLQLLNVLSFKLAGIILLLAALHYINILVLSLWRKTAHIK